MRPAGGTEKASVVFVALLRGGKFKPTGDAALQRTEAAALSRLITRPRFHKPWLSFTACVYVNGVDATIMRLVRRPGVINCSDSLGTMGEECE